MKDRKQRRTLSGAVLVMVLTVMFVLIILLMATLTVVTTANQRIYTKFEENQAYYTARSALDVYVSMLGDKTYETGADYDYGTSDTAKMKQGLALQLDLYALEAIDENGNKADLKGNLLQSDLSSNAPANKREYKNYYGYKSGNSSITYEVEVPNIQNPSDPHSRYVKFADTDASSKQKIEITVQVLSREYSFGGDISTFNTNPATATSTDKQNLAKAMMDGDRTKDSMRLKITVNATLNNTVGTAVLICNAKELPAKNNSRALSTFSGASVAYMNIIDGFSAIDNVNFANGGSVYGNIYSEKDFNIGSSIFYSYLTENECFYIGGNSTTDDSSGKVRSYEVNYTDPENPTVLEKSKRPFIYVGGTFNVRNSRIGWNFGEKGSNPGPTQPTKKDEYAIDLLTNGLVISNGFYYNGDIYCKGLCNLTGTANIGIYGDLYIDGDLRVGTNGNAWEYKNGFLNVPAGSNVYLSTSSKITDWSGTVLLDNTGSGIASATKVANGFEPFSGASGLYFKAKNDPTEPNKNTADNLLTDVIEVKLPSGVEKKLPSTISNYNEYYKIDSDGDFIDNAGNKTTNPANYVVISAEEYAFTTKSDLSKGKYSNKEFTTTDVGTTTALTSTTRLIDTSDPTTPTKYTLAPTDGKGTPSTHYGTSDTDYLHIKGGGTVEFLFQPTGAANTYCANILVDDDTTLKMYFPKYNNAATTYNLDVFRVWNNETLSAFSTGSFINVGSKQDVVDALSVTHHITVPSIYYYASDNVNISLNCAENSFLTGYLYAPDTTLSGTNSHKYIKYYFNGNNITSHASNTGLETFCVGSVLCKDVTLAHPNGVAYINPDLASSPVKGDPPLRFESYHYERN